MTIQELYSVPNLDDLSLGLISNTEYQALFDAGPWRPLRTYNPPTNAPSIIDVGGVRSFGHFFKQGFWGSETGLNQISRLGNSVNQTDQELWWGCNFMFESGFLYSITGKFMGLCVGTKIASGGAGPASNMITNNLGATIRLAPTETSNGIRWRLYVYDYNMTGKFGTAPGGTFGQVITGQWQQLVVRTRINPDPNIKNGICQVWLDGILVLSVDNLWLNHPDTTWTHFGEFAVSTFMGGGDSRFGSKRDQYIYQRNMFLWKITSGGLGQTLYAQNAEIVTPMGTINDGGNPPENPPQGTISGNVSTTTNSAVINFTYSGADQTGFEYRVNSGSISSATSPISLTGLTPSTSYTVEIRAINTNGVGSWFSFTFSTQSVVSTEPPISITSGARKIKHKPEV